MRRPVGPILALTLGALAGWPGASPAQNPETGGNKLINALANPPKPQEPTALSVSPAAAPVPALKYLLLPLSSELNPGDAAPIYLRNRHEMTEEGWRQIADKSSAWLTLPLDKFPTDEAGKFVDMWRSRLRQIDLGARRQTCDWSYTLPEQREDAIMILLPDAQSMRNWARLLALRVRVDVARGKADDAVRDATTGLAFARHVAEGPFVISELVGIACANMVLAPVEELVARPGSPNLYWALTALPRPFISLRHGFETENRMADWVLPELTDLERPRTEAEWAARLAEMHRRIGRLIPDIGGSDKRLAELRSALGPDAPALARAALPAADAYLSKHGVSRDELAKMPAARRVLLYLSGAYREHRDALFRAGYLDYPDARPFYAAVVEPTDPSLRLVTEFLAAIKNAHQAVVRLDRRIAALRVIEALRLYAAGHEGKFPASLDKVTEVPIPLDPAAGKPFEYRLDGDAALLSATPVDLPGPWLSYRITVRKDGTPAK